MCFYILDIDLRRKKNFLLFCIKHPSLRQIYLRKWRFWDVFTIAGRGRRVHYSPHDKGNEHSLSIELK